jgi:anti-anti-sigma factor
MAGLDIKLTALKQRDNTVLAEMAGAIDTQTRVAFQEALEEILNKGVRCLILDMSNIRYVNSTGLGSLVKYADSFKNSGGGMALIKVPQKVKIVIEMLGLNAFFDICAELDEALVALDRIGAAEEAPAVDAFSPAAPALMGSVAPVAPVVAAPSPVSEQLAGPVAFPYETDCRSCGVELQFPAEGRFKCPRCHVAATLEGGRLSFTRPAGAPAVAVSLPARLDCGEGLLHMASTVCRSVLSERSLEVVRYAVHEVVQVMHESIYQGNPDGLYHVLIDCAAGKVDIRFSDHGATVEPQRFVQSKRMDSFECVPHPKGGNIIRMTKAG